MCTPITQKIGAYLHSKAEQIKEQIPQEKIQKVVETFHKTQTIVKTLKTLEQTLYEQLVSTSPKGRKECVVDEKKQCDFSIRENPKASGKEPWYEWEGMSEVNRYDKEIRNAAATYSVDADLIRSVMHMETTHGYYDQPLSWANLNKTVLPMNIHVGFWGKELGVDRKAMEDPEKNINTGALLLSRIQKNLPPGASIAQVATLYNNLYATEVSDYGKRVEQIYQEKPWTKKPESPKPDPNFYPPTKLFFMPLL